MPTARDGRSFSRSASGGRVDERKMTAVRVASGEGYRIRPHGAAEVARLRAAGMELAAGRPAGEAWHFALQLDVGAALVRIGLRLRRQQAMGVGMRRPREDRARRSVL